MLRYITADGKELRNRTYLLSICSRLVANFVAEFPDIETMHLEITEEEWNHTMDVFSLELGSSKTPDLATILKVVLYLDLDTFFVDKIYTRINTELRSKFIYSEEERPTFAEFYNLLIGKGVVKPSSTMDT
jgi:hypothetical protein